MIIGAIMNNELKASKLAKLGYNDVVANHNDLSSSNLDLDLNEEKLLFMAMAFYHKTNRFNNEESKKIKPDDWIEIHALDFGCQLLGIDLSQSPTSAQIAHAENTGRVALRRLGINNEKIFSKIVKFRTINNGKIEYYSHSIVTGIRYIPEDKIIKVRFAPEIYEYFSNQKSNFNTFYVKYLSVMNTRYGAKLYRYLNAHLFKFEIDQTAEIEVDYEELKFALSCENKYLKSPQNFKDRVLIPAVNEINTKTNFELKFKTIVQSNKTSKVYFQYNVVDSYKIIKRIKQIKLEEKRADKQGKVYVVDGSHFRSPDRIKQMNIIEKLSDKQVNFLLSSPDFLRDYSAFFDYKEDTATVKKKLKNKMIHEYDSFKEYPIDFEYYAWLKENAKYGVTEDILKTFKDSGEIVIPDDEDDSNNDELDPNAIEGEFIEINNTQEDDRIIHSVLTSKSINNDLDQDPLPF